MLQIHKASAGSGKTFTLTRQYITLLLGYRGKDGQLKLYQPDNYGFSKPKVHGSILAITFTNKATQEMTARIVKELALIADSAKGEQSGGDGSSRRSDHLDYLTEVFNSTPQEVAQAARRALADLLFNFSWFNVSTIDSFFQNVLHTFTRELDLPENFNLEIDESFLVAVAIGEMTGSINLPATAADKEGATRQRRLKNWLKSYMESLIDQGSNANLFAQSSKLSRQLARTITNLRGETFKKNQAKITEYLSDPERLTSFVGQMNGSLSRLKDDVVRLAGLMQQQNEYELIPKTLRENYIDRWASGDFSYSPLTGSRTTLQKALQPDGKRHNADKPKLGLIWNDDIDQALVGVLQIGLRYFHTEALYSLLRRQIYLLGLFSEACRHIEEYCRENESFILSDTNSLLARVINETETPFVYERIGYSINHFLIDEFQDTSEMQWSNLSPLVMESMSRKKDNLIIGDEKQCIYRFRNSNPELLGSIVEDNTASRFGNDSVSIAGVSIEQNTNWRSCGEIVTFNNTIFAQMARMVDNGKPTDLATSTYSGLIQQVAPRNRGKGGYVKMIFGPEDDTIRWTDDDYLRHLGQEIDRQLSLGYSPADIAVLIRSHKQGQAVIAYLLDLMKTPGWAHGKIDILSADALEISTSPAVQLVIGILRLTTTPQYVVDTSRSLTPEGIPQMKLNPEFLRNRLIHRYELSVYDLTDTDIDGQPLTDVDGNRTSRRITPEEALSKAIRATSLRLGADYSAESQEEFNRSVSALTKMDCPSLFSLTERIIREFVPEESRESEAPFLTAFQDLVYDFEEQGSADVESFLRWWDSRGHRHTLPAPEGMNAISVMTIHQSKGLEFPCVHIPFCASPLVMYSGEDWYSLDPAAFPGIDPAVIPSFIPLSNSSTYKKLPALSPQIARYEQLQAIDTLNVAYVAFTRAVNELVIYSSPANKKTPENLGSYLYNVATTLSEEKLAASGLSDQEMKWVRPLLPSTRTLDNGLTILEIGDDQATFIHSDSHRRQLKQNPTANATAPQTDAISSPANSPETMETPPDPDYLPSFDAEIPYERILSGYTIERPAEMLLPDDVEQQGVFDINDERHVGNFLHDALAHVAHLSDLPQAMERAAYRRNLSDDQWRPYLEKLTAALSSAAVRPWFEDYLQLMTERPLTAPGGLRRPDRIVVMPSGDVVVIDYKFGQPHRKYRDQVREYMALLATCGHTHLRGFLFFPLTGELVSVD